MQSGWLLRAFLSSPPQSPVLPLGTRCREVRGGYAQPAQSRRGLGPLAVAGVLIGFCSCGMFVGLYSPQLLALSHLHSVSQTLHLSASGIGSNSPPLPVIPGPCNVPRQLLHPKVEFVPKLLNLGWPGDLLRTGWKQSCAPTSGHLARSALSPGILPANKLSALTLNGKPPVDLSAG